MTGLTPRRVRCGRYEYLCRCGHWYAVLAAHIHRYHRAACTCLAFCKPRRRATLRRLDPLANPLR